MDKLYYNIINHYYYISCKQNIIFFIISSVNKYNYLSFKIHMFYVILIIFNSKKEKYEIDYLSKIISRDFKNSNNTIR